MEPLQQTQERLDETIEFVEVEEIRARDDCVLLESSNPGMGPRPF